MENEGRQDGADRRHLAAFLVNEFGDHYLHDINGSAFNKLGSSTVFRRHFGDQLWQQLSLNLVIGSDSGLLIEHILRHGVPEGARFIFIEPPAIRDRVLARLGEQLADEPRILVTDAENWEAVAREHRVDDYILKGRLRVLRSVCATDGNLAVYTELYWAVKDTITVLNWRLIGSHGNAAFIRTELENLAENRIPAAHLCGAFAGKTAVLFGGGPSFDEVLPWVREHRDDLVVIAVSRVCRQLAKAGFTPDIVVSLDPHNVSFDVSKELLTMDPGILFVAAFHANPPLLAQWPGPIAYIGPRYPWRSELNPPNIMLAGPTVTNTALQLAVDMGCAQVVFGGVDLCFSREGFTHAKGSNERDAGPLLGPLGIRVETNDGGQGISRQDFVSSIRTMGNQAEQAVAAGCEIINPVGHAARIPHVTYRTLDRIRFEPLDRPAVEIIRDRLPPDDGAARTAYYRQTLQELDRVDYRLDKIRQLADEGLACNDGLFGRNGKRADFKYKKRMDKVERILNERYGDVSVTVKNFGDSHFLRLIRLGDDDWTDEEIEQAGRIYYQTYRDSVDGLKKVIDDTRRRVASRLEEEQPEPDFATMLAQWRADGHPGRARLWRFQHPDHAVPAAHAEAFAVLDAEFERQLSDQDTAQRKWCNTEYNLGPVRGKALFLFQNQDDEELSRLAEGLSHYQGNDAERLSALAEAYALELNGDVDAALGRYQSIIDDSIGQALEQQEATAVLQDALARVTQISLAKGDADNALLALECLSGFAPAFQPYFAEVLKLTGRMQDAIEIYNRYLQQAPNDLATMLRLGRLYQEIGIAESARMAFNYVLERDPDDIAAKKLLAEVTAEAAP